jgi:hypothetical protein
MHLLVTTAIKPQRNERKQEIRHVVCNCRMMDGEWGGLCIWVCTCGGHLICRARAGIVISPSTATAIAYGIEDLLIFLSANQTTTKTPSNGILLAKRFCQSSPAGRHTDVPGASLLHIHFVIRAD